MKKAINYLVLFYLIQLVLNADLNCSDIADRNGFTNCSLYEGGYPGFSCYQINIKTDDNQKEFCSSFPDEQSVQKQYVHFYTGFQLEQYSTISGNTLPEEAEPEKYLGYLFWIPEKETYSKGETIQYKKYELTDSDKKVIQNKKNCFNLYYGKIFEIMMKHTPDQLSSISINDKNLCFNAEQFKELEDLLDCGYAQLNFETKSKKYQIKTCFFVQTEEMADDLLYPFSQLSINALTAFMDIVVEMNKDGILQKNANKIRKLEEEIIDYEIIIESKNGKKIRYTKDKDFLEVIEKGSDVEIIRRPDVSNAWNYSTLNTFITLSLLSLLL